ncbi:hypothetical protein AYK87_06490 [Stutzerimonas stutzeri]|nr:hypothetical protein AYK87_06490 [Stutzerimonas stutzeri]
MELLSGEVGFGNLKAIGKRSAKTHTPAVSDFIVEKIGDITDCIMLPLFDELRPYAVHNSAMRGLLEALNDPAARADLTQSKCKSLIFEGSGARSVFEEHTDRLKKRKDDLFDIGQSIPPHLDQQIVYCESVSKALEKHEDDLKLTRAFRLFNIDQEGFFKRDKVEVDQDVKILRGLAKSIFDTVSTQAFQLGFLMAVLTAVDRVTPAGTNYSARLLNTKFLTALYLAGLNAFFAAGSTKHRTLAGYVSESRAKAFDSAADGFRGLLHSGNVRELNEKQWEFFRFVVLEVVHSHRVFEAVRQVLEAPEWAAEAAAYKKVLPELLTQLAELREKYFQAAVRSATGSEDFRRICVHAEAQAKAEGKNDAQCKEVVDKLIAAKRLETEEVCRQHLAASLGKLEEMKKVLHRFGADVPHDEAQDVKVAANLVVDSLLSDDVLHDLQPPKSLLD